MEGPHRVVGALSRVWGGLSCGETILTSGLVPGHEKGPTVGSGAFYVRFRRLGEDAASVVGVAVAVRTVLDGVSELGCQLDRGWRGGHCSSS